MQTNVMKKLSVLGGTALAAGQASAYDWSTVTGAVSFSGELTAVAAIVGLIAAVYVTIKGGKIVLGLLR